MAGEIVNSYNEYAAAMMQLGLIGIWNQRPLLNGAEITEAGVLPSSKGTGFPSRHGRADDLDDESSRRGEGSAGGAP